MSNVTVLGRQEDLWFLSVFCPACYTPCLVAAIVKEGKPARITDLTDAERQKFNESGKLSIDDSLDMYNFLKSFNGNFSELFIPK
jgi:hypothetical protein